MGAQLAALASVVPKLTPNQRVVLMVMCLHAMDSDAPPVYFAGWDLLALALDRPDYTEADHRAIARHVSVLVARGLIEPDGWDPRTHQRRYRILLLPTGRPGKRSSTGPSTIVGTRQKPGGRARPVRWSNRDTE